MPLFPIRRIIEVSDNLLPKKGEGQFHITLECNHLKTVISDTYEFSICKECEPVSDHWVAFDSYRMEWICKCGTGHCDPRMVKHGVHGCDGCCSRPDWPGQDFAKKEM